MNHAGDAATRPSVPIRSVFRHEDQGGAASGAGQARSPPHRIGEDGPEAQRQRVGPLHASVTSTGSAGVPNSGGQRRPAARERQHHMRFGPVQTEQAEEAEAPGDASQDEAEPRQSGGGPCPSARGISWTDTPAAPNDRPSSSIAARLLSLVEHEKMSMLTVPVSGQVCRTACDSAQDQDARQAGAGKVVRQRLHDCRAGALQGAGRTSR